MIRPISILIAALVPLTCAGCAAGLPLGPPLGLGPGLDQLVSLLFLMAIGFVVYLLLSRRRTPWLRAHRDDFRAEGAETILRERYAKGEIKREEYLEKLNDLGKRVA